jgi:assimilatory nitrate reductase catalytic subunit
MPSIASAFSASGRSPRIAAKPGLKAVDMFRAVGDGRIKGLWIMATNPVDSMPEGDRVEQALRDCPFIVVSDVVSDTDTMRHAQVRLPAAAWGEKDRTITNSERRISRQRPFLAPPGAARPDWWIICEVAKRMGFAEGFAFTSPAEIFAEHAALSAFENDGVRAFDIGALAEIDRESYELMQPFQWPQRHGPALTKLGSSQAAVFTRTTARRVSLRFVLRLYD